MYKNTILVIIFLSLLTYLVLIGIINMKFEFT